ncbi:hypothetical protein L4D09_28060 [Photobacterium makurazakiensis]|uniref:hypothetical protein n=1 Tax=Photobacterium makurazakiensis TaxID=2910234 RepID=UPI003D0A51E4
MSTNKTVAHAIRIGNRYFYQFGKGERVLTAWTLGGGRLFFGRSAEFNQIMKKIKAKGKKAEVVTFELEERSVCPF